MATINPFMQPINYATDVQSPFESALGGFKIGAGIAEIQAAQQKRDLDLKAQQEAKKRQTELADLYKNPNASSADFERLAPFLPKEQAETALKGFEAKTKREQDTDLRNGAQVYSAIKSGQPGIAIQMLTDQAAALRNGGRENEAKAAEAAAQGIELNPTAAQTTIGLYMSILPGGTDFLNNADKALSIIRTEALAPSTLKEAVAKANKGVADAITAQAAATNAPAKAKADADLAAAQAVKEKADADVAAGTVEARIVEGKKIKLAPSVQEAIDFANLTPELQNTFNALVIAKKPPAAVTNVNVTNLEKTAEGELGKLIPDLYEQANSAATQVEDIPRYRTALTNAITGPLANARLTVSQIGEFLGFTGDKRINATRELIQGLAEMGLKSRSMLTGQGAITENEQALLLKARSGDISFTKGELETIFNVSDRAARAQYDKSKSLLSSASLKSPTAQMFLDNVKALPEAPLNPNVVTVGNQTYTRPANFTDAQWNAYKQSMGVQ